MSGSITHKAVWYSAVRTTLSAEIADDISRPPTCPGNIGVTCTPQELAIRTIRDNFTFIRDSLHANTILVRLWDQDSYAGQYGGGFAYNPRGVPATMTGTTTNVEGGEPQPVDPHPTLACTAEPGCMMKRALTQEVMLTIANSLGLKIIFALDFNQFHSNTTPLGDVDDTENPRGAYEYIQQFITPNNYYGEQCTTQMVNAGFPAEVCTKSLINDARVAGWILSPPFGTDDLNPAYPYRGGQHDFLAKYWGFFAGLVHWEGANSSFAAVYMVNSGDVPVMLNGSSKARQQIAKYKEFFATWHPQPDIFGMAWYGSGSGNVAADMTSMVNWMADPSVGGYSVPASKLAFFEGGSDTEPVYYYNGVQAAYQAGVKGIAAWASESYQTLASCVSGPGPRPEDRVWDLVNIAYTPLGCTRYHTPGWHWQAWNSDGNVSDYFFHNYHFFIGSSFDTQYGFVHYTGTTPSGAQLASAFLDY